jgi:hypothetical protein
VVVVGQLIMESRPVSDIGACDCYGLCIKYNWSGNSTDLCSKDAARLWEVIERPAWQDEIL